MYNEMQKQVIRLLESAEKKENLKPWIRGYIPKHYKRITADWKELKALAAAGAAKSVAYFGTKLYFTQAVIMGASISGRYKKIRIITPSQYGKSWLSGEIALYWGYTGYNAYIAGGDADKSEIIMNKTLGHVQTADRVIREALLEPADKLQRLQTSASKKKLGFTSAGSVEGISLGSSFTDSIRGNKAVGRAGPTIIDEASLVGDDEYAELGRADFASDDGESFVRIEISNPHNPGRFMDAMTEEVVPDDTLIIWMDVRTSYEEGRVKSIEQVTESEFFKNKSTCKRYLICELEDYNSEQLFPEPTVDDSEPGSRCKYYLGIDSAYKGKDGIEATLSYADENGILHACDHVTIHKDNWIDGETGAEIVSKVLTIIKRFSVAGVCIDIGYGVYILEGVAAGVKQMGLDCFVRGINFGSGTTPERKKAKHFSAVYGENMRSELHLDVQDLMDNGKLVYTSDMAEVLKPQMAVVKAIRKQNGKTGIIPKEQIKQILGKSPDELDSVMLSVHAAILDTVFYNHTPVYGGK